MIKGGVCVERSCHLLLVLDAEHQCVRKYKAEVEEGREGC